MMTIIAKTHSDCPKPLPRRRKKRRSGISLLGRLKRLRRLFTGLRRRFNRLAGTVSSIISFVNQIRNDVNVLQNEVNELTAPDDALRSLLQARIGTFITIETDAGTISGILTAVGEDFAQVQEPTGAIVLVRFESINSFV